MRIVKSTPHNHLRTSSYITEIDANDAVKIASKRLGKGGVLGVINFNPSENEPDQRWSLFFDNLRYDKINTENGVYIPKLDLLAVHGQEVPTKEGYHVLLLGTTVKQNVRNNSSLDDVLTLKDKFGAIAIADHPFHKNGIGNFLKENPEYYNSFDGYEVFNGIALNNKKYPNANFKASTEFSNIQQNYPNLFPFASDDGHSVYEIGKSYSNIEMPSDYEVFRNFPEKVVEALKEGYKANKDKNLGHVKKISILEALDHFADLALLIKTKQYLGWDPNTKTAHLLEKIGIRI